MMSKKAASRRNRLGFTRLAHLVMEGPISTFGVVDSFGKGKTMHESHFIISIKDETGHSQLIVNASDAFKSLEAGDIIRVDNALTGRLGDTLCIKLDQKRKSCCIVWSGTSNSFEPKIATTENMFFDEKDKARIAELRHLFPTTKHRKTQIDEFDETTVQEHRRLVMINQACGMNAPIIPEELAPLKNRFSSIIVHKTPTARFVSEIHKETKGCKDGYFNIFVQVLAIYKTENDFVLQVWDGTDPIGLDELSPFSPNQATQQLVSMDPSLEKTVSPFVLNILCYSHNWEDYFRKIKKFDVILLANLHLARRSLGDLSLQMHEGEPDRRCVAVIPQFHMKYKSLTEKCSVKLEQLTQKEAAVEREESSHDELSELFNLAEGGNDTIQTWHVAGTQQSQQLSQNPQPDELMEVEDKPAEVQGVADIDEQMEDVVRGTVEVRASQFSQSRVSPVPFVEVRPMLSNSQEQITSEERQVLDKRFALLCFPAPRIIMNDFLRLTWEQEVDFAFSFPPMSVLNFKNPLKVDLDKWQNKEETALLWSACCPNCSFEGNIRRGSSHWCPQCYENDGRLSQVDVTLLVLVPLQSGNRLLQVAIPRQNLVELCPVLETLSRTRCISLFSNPDKEWIGQFLEELKKPEVVQILNKTICDTVIKRRRHDVCVLYATSCVNKDDLLSILR